VIFRFFTLNDISVLVFVWFLLVFLRFLDFPVIQGFIIAIHIRIHVISQVFFRVLDSGPCTVAPFQLSFPPWLKALVTPLIIAM